MLLCIVPIVSGGWHSVMKPAKIVKRSFPEPTFLEKHNAFVIIVNNYSGESLHLFFDLEIIIKII